MTTNQIMTELKKNGSEQTKKTWMKHGAKEPFFGVKVEDIKKIMKQVKENRQAIAMELYDTKNGDAQYMAGLMADGALMNLKELNHWVNNANYHIISEYSVAWVATENPAGLDVGLKWIESKDAAVASSGWSTISNVIARWPDEKVDRVLIRKLLQRVEKEIHSAPNRVKYCMNGFIIAAGSYLKDLNKEVLETGKKIGVVMVDMNGTACKVPYAPEYIKKVMDKGNLGKKRTVAKC